MDYKQIFSITAGVLILVSYIPYIISIFRGLTKPTKSTWICILALDGLMLASMVAKDTVNGQIIGAWIGVWITLALSFRYGVPGWQKTDTICLVIAGIGALCWVIQKDAIFGMIGSTVGYFVSYVPTCLSAYKDPSREDGLAWFICFVSCIFALFAIPVWTFAYAIQPVSFFITEGAMVYLTCVRPFIIPSSSTSRT